MTLAKYHHTLVQPQIESLSRMECITKFSCDDIGVILSNYVQRLVNDVVESHYYKSVWVPRQICVFLTNKTSGNV